METEQQQMSGERLIALLRQQQSLYRQMRVLADRQKYLITQDEPGSLLSLLAQRQCLVEGLEGLNSQMTPFRKHWSEIYASLDEACRREVANLLEEANESLGAILKGDSQDSATLSARRQTIAGTLSSMSAGSRATAAYGKATSTIRTSLTDAEA